MSKLRQWQGRQLEESSAEAASARYGWPLQVIEHAVGAPPIEQPEEFLRERLATTREEECRRLRRDLHDSLGPQLASLMMTAEAAHELVTVDPARAKEM